MKNLLIALTIGTLAFTATSRAADKVKPYALTTCMMSGEKLGEMGKPVTKVYDGQEIKFCCGSCEKTFEKDPAAGLKKYNAAVAVQSKSSGGSNPVK